MKIRRDTCCFSVATKFSCRTFFKEHNVVEDVIVVQNMVEVFHLKQIRCKLYLLVLIKQVSLFLKRLVSL